MAKITGLPPLADGGFDGTELVPVVKGAAMLRASAASLVAPHLTIIQSARDAALAASNPQPDEATGIANTADQGLFSWYDDLAGEVKLVRNNGGVAEDLPTYFSASKVSVTQGGTMQDGLAALTLPTLAAAMAINLATVVPEGSEVRIAERNGARFRIDTVSDLATSFPDGEGYAWFTDAGGYEWANCNPEPSALEFGCDPRDGLAPVQVRERMQILIDWAYFRGLRKYHLAPEVGSPYIVDYQPFLKSGTRQNRITCVIDGTIKNERDPNSSDIDFAGGCIGLGEHHPAYLDQGWVAGSPISRWQIAQPSEGDTVVTLEDTGTNRADAVAAIQSAQGASPDGLVRVFVYSDKGYTGLHGTLQHRFLLSETRGAVGPDGAVQLFEPITETCAGTWYISLADNPGTKHLTSGKSSQYVLAHVDIVGNGSLESTWTAFGRMATYRCTGTIASIDVANAYFVNSVAFSNFHVDYVRASRKLVDIAGNSHNSSFSALFWHFVGAGATNISAVLFGEQAADCTVRGGHMFAPDYAEGAGVLRWNHARRCGVDITGGIHAPRATGSPIIASSAEISAGDTQPDENGNWLDIGGKIDFSSHDRDVYISSPNVSAFEIRRASLPAVGTTGQSVLDMGAGTRYFTDINASGSLQISNTAGGSAVLSGPTFAAGFSASSDKTKIASGRIITAKSKALRKITVERTRKLVANTAPGTPFATIAVPAGSLSPGTNIRIDMRVVASGGAGTKTVTIKVDGATVSTVTLAAGSKNARVELDLFVSDDARLSATGTVINDATAQALGALLTGKTLDASGITIDLDAYKSDGADSLNIEPYSVRFERSFEDCT